MHAVARPDARNAHETRAANRRILEEASVLDHRQRFVPPADPIDDPARIEQRGRWRPERGEGREFGVRVHFRDIAGLDFSRREAAVSLLLQSLPVRIGHVRAGLFKRRDPLRDRIRLQQVVGVEVLEVAPLRQRRGSVARRTGTTIGTEFASNRAAKAAQHSWRAVGGPVVDNDDLLILDSLRERRPQGLGHKALRVVGRNQDGYEHAGFILTGRLQSCRNRGEEYLFLIVPVESVLA